ncbi:MAG: glycosyltransferase family 4 protein, partial [Akkermansiaceae bacterium]|nr:glycosyltransferase family 4 protein [Akkermansiaceae bacterium]
RPIVASDVGGTGHAILNGQTGLLYDPDDPNALTESLRRVIQDPELRSVLGHSAREFVHSHYSMEAMIRGHAELYTRLHAGTRGGEHT